MKSNFVNLQFAFFIESHLITKKSEFVTELKKCFDGNESILNVGDIPDDFPYITLSMENEHEIRIAKNRIDLFVFDLSKSMNKIISLLNIIKNINYIVMQNVGYVLRYELVADGTGYSSNDMLKIIFQDGRDLINFDSTSEILVRNLIKHDLNINSKNIRVNLINMIISNSGNSGKIGFEFDINSKPNEQNFEWNNEDNISSFIKECEKEKDKYLDKIIELDVSCS